jgi:hypothetical protein
MACGALLVPYELERRNRFRIPVSAFVFGVYGRAARDSSGTLETGLPVSVSRCPWHVYSGKAEGVVPAEGLGARANHAMRMLRCAPCSLQARLIAMARPRVTESYGGTALGAPIGGVSGGTPEALSLEAALAKYITARGLTFGGMERLGWSAVRVVFGRGPDFFYVDAALAPDRAAYPNIELLEDSLYDTAADLINEQVRAHGLG